MRKFVPPGIESVEEIEAQLRHFWERERERLGFWNDLMASPWIPAHLNVSSFFFFFRFRVKLTKKLCVSRFGFTYTVVDFSNVFVCLFVLFVFLVITGGGWWSRACLAGWALLERQHLSVFGILRTRGRNLEGFGWLLERDWDNRIFCSDVRNGNKFWVAKSGHKLSFNKCLFQLSWPKKPVLNKTNTKSPFD